MALLLKLARPGLHRNRNLQAVAGIFKYASSGEATKSLNSETEQINVNKVINANKQTNQLLVSKSCIKRLREICKDGTFLRVTVEGGGCSGFQYKFDLDKKLNDDDISFGDGDAKVVIDNISLDYCAGATVDYHEELIRAGFRMLANPLAEQGCSCGASFAIKMN